jgi:phage terminase small subunit
MARGRRGDAPGLQVAKGNPGRRPSKTAQRVAKAERVAKLLASAPAEGQDDPFAPPAFLTEPELQAAQAIWREYGPELDRTHRLGPLHRLHFAMFCVYMAQWIEASDDIRSKGIYQNVKTVAGGTMERQRPVVAWREIAYRNAMDMAREFGLTPREEYALFRDQADAVGRNPGLFDGRRGPTPAPQPDAVATQIPGAMIGAMDELDSVPPDGRLN